MEDLYATAPKPIITMQQLRKSYGNKAVLKGIDLQIMPGQVIGYIGPNGAGKSTTVRILAGLDNQFEGQVYVNGIDVREAPIEVKKIIGYVPENAELYDVLTPMEFLTLIGKLHDMPAEKIRARAIQMLDFFGLGANKDDRIDTFSKGMRQKTLLISGLIHDPQIIFLDEPLSGLDANAVIMVKEILARLARQGKTIFYCSHMMDTVEKISDRIILIGQGNILADGTFEQLRKEEGDTLEKLFSELTGETDYTAKADDFLNTFKDE